MPQPAVVINNGGRTLSLPDGFEIHLAEAIGQDADINIAGAEFDFVRSINVYQIYLSQGERADGSCRRSTSVKRGQYGINGQFTWSTAEWRELPPAYEGEPNRRGCSDTLERAVFVDWADYDGVYGFEQVNY